MDLANMTLGQIAAAITILVTIIGGIVAALRWAAKPIKGMEDRLARLEASDKEQDWRIQDSLEQRRLLIAGMHAVLTGLIEQGANGPVKSAKQEIENYLKDRPFR